uniref:Uncharacterized protein n=1 Tax=Avena sativa TaxID=4498 RepID=A0ACD5TFR4_AVESA
MGEEVINKEEAPKVEAEPKKEEAPAPAAEGGEKKAEEQPPADAPPSPPPPVILGVEVHCTGCAKRIRRSLLRCKGVEHVHVDLAANQITVKGVALDPDALCQRLRSKTKRDVTLISPLPPPPAPAEEAAEPAPPPPAPPAEEVVRTVELEVNMHCDACAEQLQRKMMKMKGVQAAETDLAAGRLTVTGTVEGEKIVEYIHRRTGKLAAVVPPPEPPKEEAPPPAEAEQKPADDGGKKEEDEKKPAPEGEPAAGEEKKDAADAGAGDEKEGKQEGAAVAVDGFPPEEMMKRMVYWPYGGAHHSYKLQPADAEEAMMARRMAMHGMPPPPLHHHPHQHHHHHPYAMMQNQWTPPPPPPPPAPMYYGGYGSSYMMERPPQMFSDENPNACVIS